MSRLARLAVVASHPIQYQAPWFRALAQAVDLDVYFCHRQDAAGQAAAGFGQPFEWDVPLLEGFRYRWLDNVSTSPNVESYRGCDTPEIGEIVADGGYDACILTGWYLKSYLQAMRGCWRAHVPVMMRGDSHLGTPRSFVKTAVKYVPYRWMLRRIDAHLYVGQANRAYLRHYGVPESRLFFAPHFVDNDRFGGNAERARSDGSAAAFRASIGAPVNSVVFLFAGKFVTHKRAFDFVQALAGLRASGRVVHGLMVGSGPHEPALREQVRTIGAPIHFAGFRNQSEMPLAYAASDCLVVPSARETWGLVVNEAMASGVPAIVSDAVGCAEDLVEPGETGFVYPAGDTPQLWECMSRVVDKLEADQQAFRPAIRARIARYDCQAAVAGVIAAMDAVTRPARVSARVSTAIPRGEGL